MLNINLDNLLFSKWFLNLKYKTKKTQAIKNLKEKFDNNKLDFLRVDEIVDTKKINDFVKEKKWDFENIVILGIWGSALWTRAIMHALKWKYYNELSRKKRLDNPKLYILDNIDSSEIDNLLENIKLKETLFIVISKSGWTIETISLFNFFKNHIKKQNLEIEKHFVIVAWENSNFKKDSQKKWLKVFDIPESIWGRFSVFTSVWLLPLAFIWVDIDRILKSVKKYRKNIFNENSNENIALLTWMINYHSYMELWKNILVLFPYATNLFYFWEWYKQLLAESLGKWGLWLTPNTAIWVTDQHSQLQLYYDWPNDKILNFIEVENFWIDYKINSQISFKQLLDIEKFATAKSITDYNKINYTLKVEKLDEENLAELILMYETQIAIMAEFFGVNAFDQPWVEIWKNIAKEKIKKEFEELDYLINNNTKNITFIGWWNGQSWILKLFKEYTNKIKETNPIKYNISSIVAMSDDWRTTWMLMKAFHEELWIHLPPPGDLRRILFTLSNSKYKDFFSIIFNKTFEENESIWNYSIIELFNLISKELLEENKLEDLKEYVEDFVNKKWKIYELLLKKWAGVLDYKLPLKTSLKGHKFWNILMASLYYNFDRSYEKMLEFMKNLLEVNGEVLPITIDKAWIKAILEDWKIIETQDNISNVADYNSTINKIDFLDENNLPKITGNIKKTIKNSDYIIIGPGDLYTSIIANFIVEWLTEEIEKTEAKIIYVLNANNKKWETTNYKVEDFVNKINNFLWNKKIDYLMWNSVIPELSTEQKQKFKNDISVKWWNYLILNENTKENIFKNNKKIKIISWEYINAKDLYRYNENLIKDLLSILK